MIDTPGTPPATTTPRRAEDAPDWGLVRFPVRCPRCAHDLRGQSQPVCPQCALDFQWHDLIPREELRCEGCSYSLFGLRPRRALSSAQVAGSLRGAAGARQAEA